MQSDLALKLLRDQNFDCLAVGVLDFKSKKFKALEISEKNIISPSPFLYFDLASLTKPLTLFAVKCHDPKLWQKDFDLLLNHRAGLPDWGRLTAKLWREDISGYALKKSPTHYSDIGALRLMLELERKTGKSLKELSSFYWDENLIFWKDLKKEYKTPMTGTRKGLPIKGQVHDDNAFVIDEFCAHAGLFARIDGLCKSLINLNDKTSFVKEMKTLLKKHEGERFCEGWDTAGENSLAGAGHSPFTFGHLGFTGTSIWIDSEKEIGHVILTNATKKFWYQREGLNKLRRELGEALWKWI